MALQIKDFDFDNNKITINKTHFRYNSKDIILSTKNEKSNRVIEIPKSISFILKEYIDSLYKPKYTDRIFQIQLPSIRNFFYRKIKTYNLRPIRLHDFRHSHASLLIHRGVNITAISKRLGHSNTKITLDTYVHLYEEDNLKLIEDLNSLLD